MPPGRRLLLRFALLVALAGACAAAVAWLGARWHEHRLAALFEGPVETAPAAEKMGPGPLTASGVLDPYSPQPVYDLKYWRASSERDPDAAVRPAGGTEEATLSPLEQLIPRETIRRYDYVDGAAREQFEAMMRRSQAVDAATGATKVVRLRNPSVYRETYLPAHLAISHPPDNAVFPPNLCAPWVEWTDPRNDLWQVTVRVDGEAIWQWLSRSRRAEIGDAAWARLDGELRGRRATIEVRGIRRGGAWGKSRETVDVAPPVSFTVSGDPADPCIVYRLVDPPFSRTKTPNMFCRRLDEKEPRPFLLSRRKYCFNCHAFVQGPEGVERLALQVRYLGQQQPELPVYFAIYDLRTRDAVRASLPFPVQMTTFMAWSPEGRRLAYSANQSLVTMPPIIHETQAAGEPASDVAVWDEPTDTTWLVKGAAEADVLEIFPRFTPDGRSIVFSRAPAGRHPALTKYQLYAVALDGDNAGVARPLAGAQDAEKSSYFARFSPDGRWFSFTRSDGGALIKSSSDIWIMRGDLSGQARRLECNAPFAADSWHSWSSNGRWIVFASKRDDGVYARLYLTHIDDDGRASPAVQLPLSEPPLMSFNIPEFAVEPPPVSERDLFDHVGIEQPPTWVKERK